MGAKSDLNAWTVVGALAMSAAAGSALGAPMVQHFDDRAGAQTLEQSEPQRQGRYLYRVAQPDGTFRSIAPRTGNESVARRWNEALLDAIRADKARPTVHARNLYHVSAAMYDAWAAFDDVADQVFLQERMSASDVEAARTEAISYAAYRVLRHRFADSVGADTSLPAFDALMGELGYPTNFFSTVGPNPAALGNRIAQAIVMFGASDGANEQNDYDNLFYEPVNPPLFPDFPGNPDINDPNRWQPLAIEFFVDQAGTPIPLGSLTFLSPEWGSVTPFALRDDDLTVHQRAGLDWPVFHDPGPPPLLGGAGDAYYKWGTEMVSVWSSHLDPTDGVMIDISPNALGNSPLPEPEQWAEYYDFADGGDWGEGWDANPATGMPYPQQIVPRGDYARILAEFWADGPDSETPPGHWFTILNYVNDHPMFEKRMGGVGPVLDDLEWDVKAYLAMGGMMHDCAITAWGCKGYYDYVRPISALRYMTDLGQCTTDQLPSFDADGINLFSNAIAVITAQTTQAGGVFEEFAGREGEIALRAWRGPEFIDNEEEDVAGVGWILAENWWPYQRPSFVTPPFAGYVSGHSTYSRGAAELMTLLTGSEFFPGGVGEFFCPQNEFLVFEDGPSQDITLQWATYRDASDQTSLSRIWGGIHPPADDIPGRHMGAAAGVDAHWLAQRLFNGQISCPADMDASGSTSIDDISIFVDNFLNAVTGDADIDFDGDEDIDDINGFVDAFIAGCPS